MYRLKYYYKNGTIKLSENSYDDIAKYDDEIRKLTKNDDFKPTENDKKDFTKYLKLALKDNEDKKGLIYRIDVTNDKTGKIIAFADDSEALIDGKKGHVTYDPDTLEVNGVSTDYDNLVYRFKYYYNDETTELSEGRGIRPTALYNDFAGLMDFDEYEKLEEKDMTTHKILEMAIDVYKGFLPDFYRIEIVNTKTNEVVDYIDLRNVK